MFGHGSASYEVWTRARPANDFAAMVPYLERTLDLSREYSSYLAPCKHIADPHIDDADESMTAASTHKLFCGLERQLIPMVRAICEQPAADDSSLRQTFAKVAQVDFALHVAESPGYDLKRGRLDLTHHPFSTRFSAGDVRITTRASDRIQAEAAINDGFNASSVNCSNEFHLMFAAADYQALRSSLFRHMRRLPFFLHGVAHRHGRRTPSKKSPAKRKLGVH